MKGILIISLCFIVATLVYSKTIGQRLDESIDNVNHEVEVIENAAGEIIIIAKENLKEAGRAITYPVRYVKNKTNEVVDAAGRRINYAVSSTRNAAGDVVEGAARGLHRAGSAIKGTED